MVITHYSSQTVFNAVLLLLTGAGAKADADDADRARRVATTADFIVWGGCLLFKVSSLGGF